MTKLTAEMIETACRAFPHVEYKPTLTSPAVVGDPDDLFRLGLQLGFQIAQEAEKRPGALASAEIDDALAYRATTPGVTRLTSGAVRLAWGNINTDPEA